MHESRRIEPCEEFFHAFLRRKGLKFTSERQAVLSAVADVGEHFDPEWLLGRMREQGVPASRATLYRTLTLLQEAGIINQVLHGHKHMHYEYVFGRGEHDHIVDVQTGQVVEFNNARVIELRDAICRELGYEAVSHRLQIFGVKRTGKAPKPRPRKTPRASRG